MKRVVAHFLLTVFTWSAIAPPLASAAAPSPYVPKMFVPRANAAIPAAADAGPPVHAVTSKAAAAKSAPADAGTADLAETEEVRLTPAVRALADTLNKNPVLIHQWVRNNVTFVPSYGAMQTAEGVMQSKRANAFDMATLTIALLRASGIWARYVSGDIEVPAAIAQNWVGGATTPLAAAALLSQGGVTVSTVTAASQVTALRVGHVWVEAYVDFHPSRGGVQAQSTTWVPIDSSFKQYTPTQGVAGATAGGFNAASVAAAARTAQTITDANGAVGLNSAGLLSAFQSFRSQAQGSADLTRSGVTVGEVLGARAITSEELPFLTGVLPYKTVTPPVQFAAIAPEQRWKVRYGVFASATDRGNGTSLANIERSVATIAGHKLTISFAPTNDSEKQVLTGLLANANPFPTSLPGAQVRMKVQMRLDGAPVMAQDLGDALMGTKWVGGASWFDPATQVWTDTPSHDVVVGETHAIVVAANGVANETLATSRDRALAAKAKLAAHDYATLTHDDLAGEALNFAALAYAGTLEGNARVLREAAGVMGFAMPSMFRASTTASVSAGNAVRFPGVALDTIVYPNTAVAKDGSATRAAGFQRLLGARASAYAHLIAQRLFTDAAHVGQGTSGVKALSVANDAGIRLYTVNNANVTAALAAINIDAASEAVVNDAALTQRRATVTATTVTVPAWTGAGYAIDDPDTGTAEYEITGRYAGAVQPAGDLAVLALAGHALAAGRGDVVADNLQTPLAAATDVAGSIAVLNADYRSIAWASWAGADSVYASWWLAAIDNGATPLLGAPLATAIDGLIAGQVTTLTGLPQPNNAPRILSQPVLNAAIGQPYQYLVTANDPDGDALTFSLTSAPSGMTISSTGLVSWASPIAGAFEVVVRVSDGKAPTDQRYVLTVGAVLPLALSLAVAPQFVSTGDAVTISVGVVGGRGPVTTTLKVDGVAVVLDANGQARITAGAAGGHTVDATSTDGTDNLVQSSFYAVGDPADTIDPVAQILTPATDTEVTTAVNIVGTASDARIAEWRLTMAPSGQANSVLLARGTTPVTNGILGRFDPSLLANGLYRVELSVVDSSGHISRDASTYEVIENLKIGQFSVSFLDLSVEAAGIPIQVTRTYDTRRKNDSLDFGYGWTVDYQSVKLQKNITTGLGWVVTTNGPLGTCVRPLSKRSVSVTLPDGRVERFQAGLRNDCDRGQTPAPDVIFTAFGKTTSTLEVLDGSGILIQGGNLVDTATSLAWNPTRFKLTTLERFVYELDQDFGIRKVTEPNGNTITYSASGIVHSAGLSVTFTRDANGRITTITDPNGKALNYAYDTAGNLATQTDRQSLQSLMQYDSRHTLTSYTDPRGVQLVRNEYDADGRLVAQYDAQGNKVDLAARDLATNKEVVKDRKGNTTTYEYDSIGNVTRMTDANGKVTSYTYDGRGNEATVTDPNGNVTIKSFDGADNQLTEEDALGHKTKYAFVPNSRDVTSITDAKNGVTAIDYTVTGNVGAITDPALNATRLVYSGANLTSLKDGAGNENLYEYDTKGRRIKETDAAGGVTTYEYDDNGNATKTTKTRTVNGVTTTIVTARTFDADGNVTSETDAKGAITRTEYNALKKVAAQTDALNRVTRFDYDPRGYETRVTHPDGLVEEKGYDVNGNPATMKDRAGRVTASTYDALNRLSKVTYADGSFTENGYDDAGRLTTVKDERGFTTTHEYDKAGRRTRTVDSTGGIWLYEYDANGNLTKATDPRLGATVHDYDPANRRIKTTYPLTPPDATARFETWEYDGAGRRVAWIDTAGNRTEYGYDGAGRLTTVKQPPLATGAAPFVTTYGYDALGNKISQTDALGRVTKWEYDDLGRMTKRILPGLDGLFETFTYDAVGNVKQHTTFKGEVVTYDYDALNRLATKSLPGGNTVTYTYTAAGQVATTADTRGTTRYTYDARDRVTKVEHPEGWVVSYGYDAAGNRASLTTQYKLEAAKVTGYEYDRANRLTKVTTPEGEVTTFAYDAAGNRASSVQPNGITTTWSYDARNRVTRIEHKKTANSAIVAAYDYTWNAQGLRATQKSQQPDSTPGPTCQTAYSYDTLGRLTNATLSNVSGCPMFPGSHTYTYDAVGNRLAESEPVNGVAKASSFSYDEKDRLTVATGNKATTYEYDANGNLVKQSIPPGPNAATGTPDQVTLYRWDAEGRLAGMTNPDLRVFTYLYDADGQLMRQVEGTDPTTQAVTYYLADKNLAYSQILEERDGSGNLKVAYQFAETKPLKQVRGTQSTYYLADHLSTRLVTDSTGAALNSYIYRPFGEIERQTGNGVVNTTAVPNVELFAGERFDSNLGLYYNRARWMDPRLGRFATNDPFVGNKFDARSLHPYAYASNDPLDIRDPTGKFGLSETVTALNIGMNIAFAFDIGYRVGSGELAGASTELLVSIVISKLGGIGLVRQVIGKAIGFYTFLTKSRRTVDLYRAVGAKELESLMRGDKLAVQAGGFEGKQFAFTLDEVAAFMNNPANKGQYAGIVKVTVDESAVKLANFSRTIDPQHFKNGVLTFFYTEMDALNKAVVSITHAL